MAQKTQTQKTSLPQPDRTARVPDQVSLQAVKVHGRIALRKTCRTAARLVVLAATLLALLIVLGIVFTIFNANPSNGIVSTVMSIDRTLVHPFSEMFTPQNPQTRVVINWGIAAACYVIAGQIVARVLGALAPRA